MNKSVKLLELERKLIEKDIEIEQMKLNEKEPNVTDNYGNTIVKSGAGYVVILPNGIRLSKSKCVSYTKIKVLDDGKVASKGKILPLSIEEIVKLNSLLHTFPESNKERAVWCEKHFKKQFTYEVIIYNLSIGTFDEWLKPVIEIMN